MQNAHELIAQLEENERVVGLVRYGSDPAPSGYQTGDFDLFVMLLGEAPAVESLHFDVDSLPVDLNLLTLEDLEALEPSFTFPALALREGKVIFDRSGAVEGALGSLTAKFADFRPRGCYELML